MERPALQRLLADIGRGQIDVVVVYKIDRLTRSLADFARIVERFDAQGVSFVSVTQAFNTTSSMGRLTLNVLLSFAQFEREVTGERIRDKIAASKAKGMWMGGLAPLGYDLPTNGTRVLQVNEGEAATVRHIFERYLALGSVHRLLDELERDGIRSKPRVSSQRHGDWRPAIQPRRDVPPAPEPRLRWRDRPQGPVLSWAARRHRRPEPCSSGCKRSWRGSWPSEKHAAGCPRRSLASCSTRMAIG